MKTQSYLDRPIPYHLLNDVEGCAVVELLVSRDGSVSSANVLRQKIGGGRSWQSLALHLHFKERSSQWRGLIRFRIEFTGAHV